MAFELNPVAVGNAAVLRAIAAGGWSSRAELAQSVGKDPRNFPRDIGVLTKAGLIAAGEGMALSLTPEAEAQLAAIDRAAGDTAAADLLPDERLVLHGQLRPDPDNPRKDFDSAEAEERLDELRTSIVQDGLLQNLVCRPDPEGLTDYIVTAGNRRWHAIAQAIFDADWPEDRLIRIKVREGDAKAALLTAIVENKQRADMSAIEEAEAFGDLVQVHGMKTIDIAHTTGLSQKVVQNRLKLLNLSADDQDRMRLPEDHPDHLGYKAALRQLTVTREPEPTLGQQVAEHGAAVLNREPGSPADDAPPFDSRITDLEALMLVELVDKAEREPDPDLGVEHYTRVQSTAMHGEARALVAKGLIATRQRGLVLLMKPCLFSTGLKDWLTDLGFYTDGQRDDVLHEMQVRVDGIDNTTDRRQCGVRYATAFLNGDEDPRNVAQPVPGPSPEGRTLPQIKPNPAPPAEAESGSIFDDDQPDLIEPTEEEKAARRRAEIAAREAAGDEEALAAFTGWMRDKLARKRAEGVWGWRTAEPRELADLLVGHVAKGDPVDVAILAMMLGIRAGAMGAPGHLRSMPTPRMEQLMIEARAARSPSPNGPEAPDPEEDFVQAELEDAEAEHPDSLDADPIPASPQEAAVPIRKSITADYIVCLEDGRKFKSLKRHLRTTYNLSPEEYRAKWGLVADYPMVAPNYAKARADLARQMGLGMAGGRA